MDAWSFCFFGSFKDRRDSAKIGIIFSKNQKGRRYNQKLSKERHKKEMENSILKNWCFSLYVIAKLER